jgi:hypothetical protein
MAKGGTGRETHERHGKGTVSFFCWLGHRLPNKEANLFEEKTYVTKNFKSARGAARRTKTPRRSPVPRRYQRADHAQTHRPRSLKT